MDGEAHSEASAKVPGEDFAESGWTTTKQAAKVLGVSRRSVQGYVRRGLLEAKVEGEGVEKTYLVAIDSLHALRVRRGFPRKTRTKSRGKSAEVLDGAESAEDYADMVRDLTDRLIRLSSEAAELRTRLELTVRAESTLQEERDQLRQDRERERQERLDAQQEAQRLREELEAERSKGFWRRLFGG